MLIPVCACWLTGSLLGAEGGVKDSEILIGQCAALAGPAGGLGTGMNAGLQAAFAEANAKGGIHGRQLKLISADDGYKPGKCVDCTETMIDAFHGMSQLELGGVTFSFSESNHQGSSAMFRTIVRDGHAQPVIECLRARN